MKTNQEHAEVAELLSSQAELLVKSGTGEVSIRDSGLDEVYQDNDRKLLQLAKKIGLPEPFPWRTLWEWHRYYSQSTSGYAERRTLIGSHLRKAKDELDAIDHSSAVVVSSLTESKQIVHAALADAEVLIAARRYTTVVDRIHTAVHGHLRWICDNSGIEVRDAVPSITRLMRLIREHHPSFSKPEALDGDIKRMFMSMGNILEAMNNVRNNASPAHPIEQLLDEPEARLAVNAAQTILTYVDEKTQRAPIELADG